MLNRLADHKRCSRQNSATLEAISLRNIRHPFKSETLRLSIH